MAAAALPPLTTVASGNAAGPTLVFIHGWPDDASLWDKMVARLDKEYYCVRVTLPNFGDKTIKPKGYAFEPIVLALTQLVIETQQQRNRPNEPVSLVLHDWGCTFGYMLQRAHPELVKNIVAHDVGYAMQFDIVAWFLFCMYQWYLILCWTVGLVAPKAGDKMASAFAKLIKAPRGDKVTAAMCYPYVYFWALLLRRSPLLAPKRGAGLCPFPCLYMYGDKKPRQFHSDAFLFAVSKRADSRVAKFAAGHWFLVGKEADQVNETVAKWLGERYAAPSPSL